MVWEIGRWCRTVGCGAGRGWNCLVKHYLKIIYDHTYICADTSAVRSWITGLSLCAKCFCFLILNGRLGIVFLGKWLLCDYMLESKWGTFTHLHCPLVWAQVLLAQMWCLMWCSDCVFFFLFILSLSFPLSYPPLPHLCRLHWCHFFLPFALSFSFSLFPQYHRDLEMSLSLSASQDQAVMLAQNKPVCVCVWKKIWASEVG